MDRKYTKEDLIYSMLLNIRDGLNDVISDIDNGSKETDWKAIINNLDEKETELVYILENLKNKLEMGKK